MSVAAEPKLAPPGAGIPFPQLLFARFWLAPVVSKRTPRDRSRADYEKITARVIELVSAIEPERRRTRVLIRPLPGLEDSSRNWSLNGVLEHLMIVSRGIEGAILSLGSGKVPDGVADTAKVKPSRFDEDELVPFTEYAPGLLNRLDAALAKPGMSFDSPLTFKHPWFGQFTARQWYWLLAIHQGIHLRQAREIVAGMIESR